MAKILAFAGSLREASFNDKLVRIASAAARKAGAEVTYIRLRDYPMPLFDQEIEDASGVPETAQKLKALMIDHDGFLIACPEYNSSITGVLKNAVDWASRKEESDPPGSLHAFRGKVVTLMSASPGSLGGLRGLVHVRSIFGNLGSIVLPDQVAVSSADSAFNDDGSLKDKKQHQQIEDLGKTLAKTLKKLA